MNHRLKEAMRRVPGSSIKKSMPLLCGDVVGQATNNGATNNGATAARGLVLQHIAQMFPVFFVNRFSS